jgi:hypothetical protein
LDIWYTVAMFSMGAIAIIIFLKYAVPIVIVFMPFLGGWTNFVLDTIDGDILIPLGLSDSAYQIVDKSADWVTYIGMVLVSWLLKWPIRKWIYALFGLRTIGQLAFFLTLDERVFFLFPNFLEPLFLAYATIVFFKKANAFAFYQKHKVIVWIIVIVYKMQDEWITHIANVDRTELIQRLFTF